MLNQSTMKDQDKSSVNQEEINHFAADSAEWWDENGPFKPLHRLNPTRLSYIRDQICAHFNRTDSLKPFTGLDILDIGCGGGLVCEPMARLGANVTGADADAQAIDIAQTHAKLGELDIIYRAAPAETLLKEGKKFDVVLALEIVEHVDNVQDFVQSCADLCKPGGMIIFSTLNRTPKSFALGIIAAERILRWVPKGTHQWKKFLRPSELATLIQNIDARPDNMSGLIFNPLKGSFELSERDIDVNYFMTAVKSAKPQSNKPPPDEA